MRMVMFKFGRKVELYKVSFVIVISARVVLLVVSPSQICSKFHLDSKLEWTSVTKVRSNVHEDATPATMNIFKLFFSHFYLTQDAKMAKPEVNLMSLLSTFDDIIDMQPEPDKEEKSNKEEKSLPRTNSLEDLGIKVTDTFFKSGQMITLKLC